MFDFCLGEASFKDEAALDRKYCLFGVLAVVLEVAREEVYPNKELVCRQIKRAILICGFEIDNLLAKLSKEDPKVKEIRESNLFAKESWAAFHEIAEEPRAALKLPNQR